MMVSTTKTKDKVFGLYSHWVFKGEINDCITYLKSRKSSKQDSFVYYLYPTNRNQILISRDVLGLNLLSIFKVEPTPIKVVIGDKPVLKLVR